MRTRVFSCWRPEENGAEGRRDGRHVGLHECEWLAVEWRWEFERQFPGLTEGQKGLTEASADEFIEALRDRSRAEVRVIRPE